MSFTYDESLPTDRDWVRFLIKDTDLADAARRVFSDEEIDAFLAEEDGSGLARRYLTAATLWGVQVAGWSAKGAGFLSKKLGDLTIARGIDQSAAQAAAAYGDGLQRRGCALLNTAGLFRVHGRLTR